MLQSTNFSLLSNLNAVISFFMFMDGKDGSAEETEHYRKLFPEVEVIGFDYRATAPWEAKEEFLQFFTQQRKHCDNLTLVANSIGAFFSMSSLDEALIDRAYLIVSKDNKTTCYAGVNKVL